MKDPARAAVVDRDARHRRAVHHPGRVKWDRPGNAKLKPMFPVTLGVKGMRYEFLIAGGVTETVRAAFPGFEFAAGPAGGTVIYGPVRDKAELRGVLARLDELGLNVVEMRKLPD